VTLSYELAGAGSRLLAAVIDHLIVALAIAIVLLLALALRVTFPTSTAPAVLAAVALGGPLLLLMVYFAIFETTWGGQTPGKRAVGLRVMHEDGTPVTVLGAVIRNVIRLFDFLPYLYFIGGLVAFLHPQTRRLGDLAAGTVVVKLRSGELPEVAAPALAPSSFPPPDDLQALVRAAAVQLTGEELAAFRRFLSRRSELTPEVRQRLARQMLGTVSGKLSAEAQESAAREPEAVLEALVHAAGQAGERF
jgi:uncharacterized RDD family membrane protein YckC